MRFPGNVNYYVTTSTDPSVTVALPTAFVPPTAAPSKNDPRQLSCRPYNAQGWPACRTVIGYKYEGVGVAPDVSANIYFWEDSVKGWFKLNGSSALTLKNGVLTWTDLASVLEGALTQKSLDGGVYSVGSIDLCVDVMVAALSQVEGIYRFAFGVDLTT